MTNEEAKAIIRKKYLCVDRDCDIERSCGKCDLMIPSKEPILEAYKMAMQALEFTQNILKYAERITEENEKNHFAYIKIGNVFKADIEAIQALEQEPCEDDHDGCKDCVYQDNPQDAMPCRECKHNYMDKWKAKANKAGHWKRISMDKYSEHAKYWYRCDRCGKDNLGNTDWCPNCGARMECEQNG